MILYSLSREMADCCVEKRCPAPIDILVKQESAVALAGALATLSIRSREAVLAKLGLHPEGKLVRQLASEWQLSRQRVYQIAANGITKLRSELIAGEGTTV